MKQDKQLAIAEAFCLHLDGNKTMTKQECCRIVQNLDYLMLNSPTTHIVVLGILPRGYWQDPKDMFKLPSAFSRAISAVNQELEHFAFGHQKMHYIDCTKAFVQTGNVSPRLTSFSS